MIYEIKDGSIVSGLFAGWEETIIWSCLQGIMGKLYGNHPRFPTAAMALLGDFAFLAGTPDPELAAYKPGWCTQRFIILVPRNQEWKDCILRHYGERANVVSRYAIKKEPDIFEKEKLQKAVSLLPSEYELRLMDEPLYNMCRTNSWSAEQVANFPDYETYRRLGLGAVILKEGELVSGASSYSRYLEGIEIQIDTREDFRRRGLACIVGARLILECLSRGLYPSWDAQNLQSVALAEKLGYHYSHTYSAIELHNY